MILTIVCTFFSTFQACPGLPFTSITLSTTSFFPSNSEIIGIWWGWAFPIFFLHLWRVEDGILRKLDSLKGYFIKFGSSHTNNSDNSSLFQLNLLLAYCPPLREGFSHWNDSSPILSSFCLLPTSPPCHLKHTTKFQKMGCHFTPSSWTDLPHGLIPAISQCSRDNGQLEIL